MLPVLVPAIFAILEKVGIGILDKAALGAKLVEVGLNSDFGKAAISVVETYLGKLTDQQRLQFEEEMQQLQGQLAIENTNAQSPSLWGKARGFTTWGLSICVVVNAVTFEIANILRMIGFQINELQTMDPITVGMLCGLLGLMTLGRTAEKINGVASDHQSD